MQTLQPVLKRGRQSWDKVHMPVAEFRKRVERVRRLMKKADMDTLLCCGSGISDYGNSCYFSNYIMETVGDALVVIPAKGKVALIFEGTARGLPAVKSMTWLEEIIPGNGVAEPCINYLEGKNLISGTIGVAGLREMLSYTQWLHFRDSTRKCKLVNAQRLVNELRARKSSKEIDQIRRSSVIIHKIIDSLVNTHFLRLNDRIVYAEAERCAYSEGAGDFRMLMGRCNENKWLFTQPGDKEILSGDNVTVYLAVEREGYWAEGIRSFVAGSGNLILSVEHAGAQVSQIIAGLKPGRSIGKYYRKVEDLLNNPKSYLPEIGLGSGIGLSLEEYPSISESETSRFKSGMCLTIRIGYISNESVPALTGYTVYISGNGCEILI